MKINFVMSLMLVSFLSISANAADEWGMEKGAATLKSVGPMAFGPDGILFVGDTKAACIFAIGTEEKSGNPADAKFDVKELNKQVSAALDSEKAQIIDLAVNPKSGTVYLSATDGANPAILKVDFAGKVSKVSLDAIKFSKITLPNPPEDKVVGSGRRARNNRKDSITDLAYSEGRVLVSGLSNEKEASTVRGIPFPFIEAEKGSPLEIFHGAHGRSESYSAIRTFVPFNIDGEPSLLAGFVCTPLVKFPVKNIVDGKKIKGTTVAELGNRNRPYDMIVYEKEGKNFLLMANSARGVMKISTENLGKNEGLTERVKGTAGQSYETVKDLEGVVQLDILNDKHAVILVQDQSGKQDLKSIALP